MRRPFSKALTHPGVMARLELPQQLVPSYVAIVGARDMSLFEAAVFTIV